MTVDCDQWVRWARHDELEEYIAQGWTVGGRMAGHHGFYSVLVWRPVDADAPLFASVDAPPAPR